MLPCNVIVQEIAEGKIEVAAIGPIASMQALQNHDLREIAEFAPYIGVRYQTFVGETVDIAEATGSDTEHLFFVAGIRFAF